MRILMIIFCVACITLCSCSKTNERSDAYGNFEAIEIIVSAESQGKVLEFNIQEGRKYPAGVQVGTIDTVYQGLQKQELVARKQAVEVKKKGIESQIEVHKEQLRFLQKEKTRLENLFRDGAATEQQLDEVNGRMATLRRQIEATETSFLSIDAEINTLDKQEKLLLEQLSRCRIINPVNGTVLEKYIEPYEMVTPGRQLYKIADLSAMILRVYISGNQLPSVVPGQKLRVFIDDPGKGIRELEGKVSWISDRAEFTPKIIQTREERVNLVYAVKVMVENDGSLKIGMPGDVRFR